MGLRPDRTAPVTTQPFLMGIACSISPCLVWILSSSWSINNGRAKGGKGYMGKSGEDEWIKRIDDGSSEASAASAAGLRSDDAGTGLIAVQVGEQPLDSHASCAYLRFPSMFLHPERHPTTFVSTSHSIENMNAFVGRAPCRLNIVLALALDMEVVDAGGGGTGVGTGEGIGRGGKDRGEESDDEDGMRGSSQRRRLGCSNLGQETLATTRVTSHPDPTISVYAALSYLFSQSIWDHHLFMPR